MSNLKKLHNRLLCPVCMESALDFEKLRLICKKCGAIYDLSGTIPNFLIENFQKVRSNWKKINFAELYEEEARQRKEMLGDLYEYKKTALPFWAEYFLILKNEWLKEIFPEHVNQNCAVVELGSADGYNLGTLLKYTQDLTAVDIALNYLNYAQSKTSSVDFIRADIASLPFKDKTFDIVLCSEVLEHVPDLSEAVAEISRICNKKCLITVPVLPRFIEKMRLKYRKNKILLPGNGHLRTFRVKELIKLLSVQGFKIEKIQYFGVLWPIYLMLPCRQHFIKLLKKLDRVFSNIIGLRCMALDVGLVIKKL